MEPAMSRETRQYVDDCMACHGTCMEAVGRCMTVGGATPADPRFIRTLTECAATCTMCADALMCGSEFAREMCDLCARICESCASYCDRMGEEMRGCAEACRRCAKSCATMSKAA